MLQCALVDFRQTLISFFYCTKELMSRQIYEKMLWTDEVESL